LQSIVVSSRLRGVTADTIYYLASTVAQTLASLAGFLGAFLLFYLQGTERSLIDYGDRFASRQGFQAATDSLLAGDFDRFEELLRGYIRDYASSGQTNVRDRIEKELEEFQKRRTRRQSAIAQFKRAVMVTAPVLLVSLVLIEFAALDSLPRDPRMDPDARPDRWRCGLRLALLDSNQNVRRARVGDRPAG